MSRPTPNKLSRTARVDQSSPYARPSDPKVKRSTSLISFPGIRSLVSYMTYPFSRSPSSKGLPISNLDVARDSKSESGSEDNWEGAGPNTRAGQDVFDVSESIDEEASGNNGRTDQWRARGEVVGGRRDTARRNLIAPQIAPPVKSPVFPGHYSGTSPLTSNFQTPAPAAAITTTVPVFGQTVSTSSSTLKRRLSPAKPPKSLPPRSPIPPLQASGSQDPPVATPSGSSRYTRALPSTSTSALALKTFLDVKSEGPLSLDDVRTIELLTERVRHESDAGSVRGTPIQYGGWVAGSFTPRPIKPVPSTSAVATPTRPGSVFGSPAPGFSVGISPPQSSPWKRNNPGQVQYIGPGWSARRVYGQQRKSGLKPLLDFGADEDENNEDGLRKKRRKEDDAPGLVGSRSMPNLAGKIVNQGHSGSPSAVTPRRQDEVPKPVSAPRQNDAVSVGKRRAANIMLDLINSELGLTPETKEKDTIIVNPYHPDAFALPNGTSPASSTNTNVPNGLQTPTGKGELRKSILKQSVSQSTPLRGAAKRMEEARRADNTGGTPAGTKMSTLQMLAGQAYEGGSETKKKGKAVRIETPGAEEDSMEVEDLVETRDSSSDPHPTSSSQGGYFGQSKSTDTATPQSKKKLKFSPESEVTPLPAPQLFGSPAPIAQQPKPTKADQPFQFMPAYNAGSDGLQPNLPAATFSPSPLSKPTQPESESASTGFSFGVTDAPKSKSSLADSSAKTKDFSSIYLSAKEMALAIAKEALPFFAFTLPSTGVSIETESTKAAKEAAKAKPLQTYSFSLDAAPPQFAAPQFAAPTAAFTPKASSGDAKWTCDLCMLQNPQSAVEKCQVCEAPRPAKSLPTSSAVNPTTTASIKGGFDWSAAGAKKPAGPGGASWTCSTCFLSNPASATEKCTICESLRPGVVASKKPDQPAAAPQGTYLFGAKPAGASGASGSGLFGAAPASTAARGASLFGAAPGPAASTGGGFNWSAAGASAPKGLNAGEWKCSLCDCTNPTDKQKCTVCETPR